MIHSLSTELTHEINADYAAIFNEKKYKDLMTLTKCSDERYILLFQEKTLSFEKLRDEIYLASSIRVEKLTGKKIEDGQYPFYVELYHCYQKALAEEKELIKKAEDKKAKEQAMIESNPKMKKKAAGKEMVTSLQFGKGTRTLYSFFVNSGLVDQLNQVQSIDGKNHVISENEELISLLQEITQSSNQERRLPKCAKGTRDMTPF